MPLIIKQPIATLHKKEQHISIKPMHKTRKTSKVRKTTAKKAAKRTNAKRVSKQLKLRLK